MKWPLFSYGKAIFIGAAMTNKIVVITGASTGIGAACAHRLDQMGFQVFAGVRKISDGEALQQQSRHGLTPLYLDVTEPESIAAAKEVVAAAVGPAGLAGLVNNAGVATGGPLEFVALADLRWQLEVNVIGQVAVTQAFLPHLRQGRGRIINIGSIGGRSASPFLGPYVASKFALEALTDSLRLELAPWGIDVVIIEPGEIATPIWRKGADKIDQILANYPPQAQELYGPIISMMRKMLTKAGGLPADEVAKVVAQALTAKRPKTRYLVGRDAKVRVWLERLPDRWRDKIIAGKLPDYG
jgi:NAD(P)-dependent dehydrogenase (short-subunit alcohol dehydrogenase family)